MLPENKQALDRLYDGKQTQAEFTGRALLDPETTRLRPKDAMQFWTAAKNQPKPTPRPEVTEQKSEVMERHFAAANGARDFWRLLDKHSPRRRAWARTTGSPQAPSTKTSPAPTTSLSHPRPAGRGAQGAARAHPSGRAYEGLP